MRKRIIISKRCGQLGNALYRLSNLVAFAIDNNITVWDRSMFVTDYSELFPNINRRLLLSYPNSTILPFNFKRSHEIQSRIIKSIAESGKFKIRRIIEKKEVVLNLPEMFSPGVNTIVLRGLHYTANDCVRHNATYLRWLFAPTKDVISIARSYFSRLAGCSDIVVAVHIRQGDFKEWRDGQFFFEMEYYAKAMKQTMKLFPQKKVQFILFSDNKNLNKSAFKGFSFVFSEHGPSIDWFLMSLCNYIIAPLYSTFSGWASFYGETPIYRLNGRDCPQSASDFIFEPFLNNSREHNQALEAI